MASTCSRGENSRRQLLVGSTQNNRGTRPELSTRPVFVQAKNPAKAMIAYERALDWRELFDLAVRESTPQDKLVEVGLRVAGKRWVCCRPTLVLIGLWQMS